MRYSAKNALKSAGNRRICRIAAEGRMDDFPNIIGKDEKIVRIPRSRMKSGKVWPDPARMDRVRLFVERVGGPSLL